MGQTLFWILKFSKSFGLKEEVQEFHTTFKLGSNTRCSNELFIKKSPSQRDHTPSLVPFWGTSRLTLMLFVSKKLRVINSHIARWSLKCPIPHYNRFICWHVDYHSKWKLTKRLTNWHMAWTIEWVPRLIWENYVLCNILFNDAKNHKWTICAINWWTKLGVLQPGLHITLSILAFEVSYMSTPMEGIQQTGLQPSLKKIIHGNNVEMLNPPRRVSMSALCSAAKILIFELEVPILVIAGFS